MLCSEGDVMKIKNVIFKYVGIIIALILVDLVNFYIVNNNLSLISKIDLPFEPRFTFSISYNIINMFPMIMIPFILFAVSHLTSKYALLKLSYKVTIIQFIIYSSYISLYYIYVKSTYPTTKYIFTHTIAAYLILIDIALLMLFITHILNKKFKKVNEGPLNVGESGDSHPF